MKKLVYVLLLSIAGQLQAAELIQLDRFVWRDSQENFGGFSGIEVNSDGSEFTAISDKGRIVSGKFIRRDGHIDRIESGSLVALQTRKGQPVGRFNIDSEGLAIDDAGHIHVSFESNHRVWRYDTIGTRAQELGTHPDFRHFQDNSGMEALAIDPGGVLYTLPERSGALNRPFPVYRYKNGAWEQPFSIPRTGVFLPVGADFSPDGKFYLLERDFVWYSGFSTRIRRFDLTQAGFVNEEVLLTTGFGTHDNLEGLATWSNSAGQICLTMVSDDNFKFLQVTEFVEYCLAEVSE